MFLRLGQTYYASLRVTDFSGRPVNDDVPLMTIQDTESEEYYNGIHWQKQQIGLALMCLGDGNYSGQFTPDKTGSFSVMMTSGQYGSSSTDVVEVYDTVDAVYKWQKGVKYTVTYTSAGSVEDIYCVIADENTGEYWNGISWQTDLAKLSMSSMGGDQYGYVFLPQNIGRYCIAVHCGSFQYQYILEVVSKAKNIAPVIVTNRTLHSLDGSDSTVLADNGFPIPLADVIVYDPATKEVVARTQTGSSGEWQLSLTPGIWQFLFEKDGYISVSFERMVS